MNWDAIGAIGEIVGAMAVVLTLGYLAVQIRQNTHVARGQTEISYSEATADWHARLSADPEMIALWRRGVAGDPLTIDEAWRYVIFNAEWFYLCQGCFYQHRRGLMSESAWNTLVATMISLLKDELLGPWWDSGASSFDLEFVQYINGAKEKADLGWDRAPNTQALDQVIASRAGSIGGNREQE